MTRQSVRVGNQEVVITPAEAEDGSFVASSRGKHADQAFAAEDWTDPQVRLVAARAICEAFAITRNNQHLTKVAKAIDEAMARCRSSAAARPATPGNTPRAQERLQANRDEFAPVPRAPLKRAMVIDGETRPGPVTCSTRDG